MNDVEVFSSYKEYLFSIAYRITGSYQDSEDIVQETYLRFQKLKLEEISNTKAYLGKISAHLAFDLLKKAERRRETYIGPYLPEPIPSPVDRVEEEQMDFAFLILLESLNPIERAVYILREAFGFEYEWISEIVGKNPENCRQVFSRAKSALKERKNKFQTSEQVRAELIDEFLFACYSKDIRGLSNLLREEIVAYSDGGGKVHAARIPISGKERTVRFLVKTSRKKGNADQIYYTWIEGKRAIVGYKEEEPVFLQYLKIQDRKIEEVYTILNPEKLRAFQRKNQLIEAGILKKLNLFDFLRIFLRRFFLQKFFRVK